MATPRKSQDKAVTAKKTTSSGKNAVSSAANEHDDMKKETTLSSSPTTGQNTPASVEAISAATVKGALPPAMVQAMDDLKKDAKWMKFVAVQKQHLLDLRDNILDSMNGVARETLKTHPEGSEASGSGEHQADAGSDAYDRDFALSLLAKDQNALAEIGEALKRIEVGTYGICEMSYKQIPILRLKAIPFARLSVECQAKWEKEKGRAVKFTTRDALGFAGMQNDSDFTVSLDEDEE